VQFEKLENNIKATVNSSEDGSFYGIYKIAADARAVTGFTSDTALVFQPWSDD
jgi:hypothetical protein